MRHSMNRHRHIKKDNKRHQKIYPFHTYSVQKKKPKINLKNEKLTLYTRLLFFTKIQSCKKQHILLCFICRSLFFLAFFNPFVTLRTQNKKGKLKYDKAKNHLLSTVQSKALG